MNLLTEGLKKALTASQQILDLASEQDWEQVETKLNHRDQTIREVLNLQATPEEANDVRKLIAQIKAVDEKISTLVKNRQNEISSDIKQQNQGKKMHAAYTQAKRHYK